MASTASSYGFHLRALCTWAAVHHSKSQIHALINQHLPKDMARTPSLILPVHTAPTPRSWRSKPPLQLPSLKSRSDGTLPRRPGIQRGRRVPLSPEGAGRGGASRVPGPPSCLSWPEVAPREPRARGRELRLRSAPRKSSALAAWRKPSRVLKRCPAATKPPLSSSQSSSRRPSRCPAPPWGLPGALHLAARKCAAETRERGSPHPSG